MVEVHYCSLLCTRQKQKCKTNIGWLHVIRLGLELRFVLVIFGLYTVALNPFLKSVVRYTVEEKL